MSKITIIPLLLSITYLLIACGNAPVALPQGDEPTPNPINQAEEPTPEPLDSVSSTPDVEMYGGTVLVNDIPFTFSTPQEISSTRKIVAREMVSWLPDGSSRILLIGNYDVGILDLDTQTTTIYASGEAPMATNEQPIWLPESEAIAYIFYDVKAKQHDLYISKGKGKEKLILPHARPPIIPIKINNSFIVYNKLEQRLQQVTTNGQLQDTLPSVFETLQYQEPWGYKGVHRIAQHPHTAWMAYYNIHEFYFFNPETADVKELALGGSWPETIWALDAQWSPDGKKMALMITQGEPVIPYCDLYIFDWETSTLQKIEDEFKYISGMTWASDSQHLLFTAVIGKEESGVNLDQLFIIDTLKPESYFPIPIPTQGLIGGFGGNISWVPNSQTVLVGYAHDSVGAIHQIKVESPVFLSQEGK